MADSIELSTWEMFEQRIRELRAEYGGRTTSPLLYRGQGNADCTLTTTLDRSGQGPMLFREYYELTAARFASSLRVEFLRRLSDYNLNAFSLFEPEESLLETMWVKEQVLRTDQQ